MSKIKSQHQNIIQITLNALKLYLKNIIPLTKVMLFPVFGQVAGIILILYPTYFLSLNITKIFPPPITLNNLYLLLMIQIIAVLPGFFVFTKAFWEYLVAFASINSMIMNIKKSGTIKDTAVINQLFKLRSHEYILFLSIFAIIWLISIGIPIVIASFFSITSFNPTKTFLTFLGLEVISIFVMTIISIYLSISTQIFTIEELSPFKAIKKSWQLVNNAFFKTMFLGILSFIITGLIIPLPFQYLASKENIAAYITQPFIPFVTILSNGGELLSHLTPNINAISGIFTHNTTVSPSIYNISQNIAIISIGSIISGFLLPLSTAFFVCLYLDINKKKPSKGKKK